MEAVSSNRGPLDPNATLSENQARTWASDFLATIKTLAVVQNFYQLAASEWICPNFLPT
jgi:hypothetical protein